MKLETRTVKASKLKNKDLVAGVLYGSGIESISVSAPALEFQKHYFKYGTSKTFEVELEGQKHIVYLKEVVPDRMKIRVYNHFDLIKVSADDTLTSKVRVIWVNKELVEKQGFIINSVLDDVEIEYAVGKGISHLDLDVKDLKDGDSLSIKDILPIDGVKILDDPEALVLTVSRYKEKVEVDPDAEEETDYPADE